MAYSKVIFNGSTLMDVTQKTVTAETLLQGETALKNDGTSITGTYVGGGGSDKTVSIALYMPTSASYFRSFTIYETTDGVRGNQIGSIASADGSTTVTVSASATGIECECIGDYVSPSLFIGDYGMIGDIGLTSVSDGTAIIGFAVASSGSIEIQRIDWSD